MKESRLGTGVMIGTKVKHGKDVVICQSQQARMVAIDWDTWSYRESKSELLVYIGGGGRKT